MEGGHILSSPLLRKSLRRKHKCWVRSGVGRTKKNELSLSKLDSRRIRASRGCMGVATGADSTVRKCKTRRSPDPGRGRGRRVEITPCVGKAHKKASEGHSSQGMLPLQLPFSGLHHRAQHRTLCPADTRGYTPTPVLLAALLASFLQKPETNFHGRAIW